ncbi:hypothetical protein COLO4_03040 [Corchorus olitorius]|uniref:Uncharacterized protein n=1 Tax=Corchorus olitorius TaxID=93759 RepID=A0A1R3KZT3_9ROSI|nr:hypothetical protein COLO4_03040 [Corchorus olitorius]
MIRGRGKITGPENRIDNVERTLPLEPNLGGSSRLRKRMKQSGEEGGP